MTPPKYDIKTVTLNYEISARIKFLLRSFRSFISPKNLLFRLIIWISLPLEFTFYSYDVHLLIINCYIYVHLSCLSLVSIFQILNYKIWIMSTIWKEMFLSVKTLHMRSFLLNNVQVKHVLQRCYYCVPNWRVKKISTSIKSERYTK